MASPNTGEAAAGGGVRRRARTTAQPVIRRNPRRAAKFAMTEARRQGSRKWIVAILKRARDRLANDGAWLRNDELADCYRACDARGRPREATAPDATRWTANAVIELAAHEIAREAGIQDPDRVRRAAGLALQAINPLAPTRIDPESGRVIGHGLCAYNAEPTTTLADILHLFDKAIAETDTRKDAPTAGAATCS